MSTYANEMSTALMPNAANILGLIPSIAPELITSIAT